MNLPCTCPLKEKGFMSLYDGLSAGILRQVFYTTSRFGLYEVFRDEMAKYRPTDFFSRMLTGCVSGGIAALISCPAEVTMVRISNDASLPDHARRNYKGVRDAFLRITREEGPKAFFSGSSRFIKRAMVVGAVQIGTLISSARCSRATYIPIYQAHSVYDENRTIIILMLSS
jgi:solute carrier family 25 oxoglutarate transporter 11